jgi:hypothetical protein
MKNFGAIIIAPSSTEHLGELWKKIFDTANISI